MPVCDPTSSAARTPLPRPSSAPRQSGPPGQTTGTDGPKARPSGKPGSPSSSSTSTSSSTPTPHFQGLCRAFQATDRSANGSSPDSAAFTALSQAAATAGAADVAAYCVDLIGEPKTTGKPSVLPTPTSKPTNEGGGKRS